MYVVEKIGLSRIITRLLFSVPGVYLMDTRICMTVYLPLVAKIHDFEIRRETNVSKR